MPTLASDLRSKLERVVIDGRDAAEAGDLAAVCTGVASVQLLLY